MVLIGLPKFRNEKIITNQNTQDIVKLILLTEKKNRNTAKKISKLFKGDNNFETCKKIFDYLKRNFKYEKESEEQQTTKSLERFIFDKKGDCKHFAIFVISILNALNIPCFFRLISQNYYSKLPKHIYAVALINGNEIIIDAVTDNFNCEPAYKYKFDVEPLK